MKKSLLLLILPALLLSSCGSSNEEKMTVNYTLAPSLRKADSTKTGGYDLTFKMEDSYFDSDATKFNKDIALLSNGKSLMAETEATIKSFYSAMEFDNLSINYPEHTEDTIQYAIAHKKIGEYNLVSVAINGHNYGLEWKNNALLGLEGDHEGFSARANDVYDALKAYLSENKYTNYKLWLSGYSRGGAISNVLSHYILSEGELTIAKKDMFVYTFECPKGLDENNAPKYENVFNIVYSGDTVTYMAPSEYGFARCGIDIELYQSSTHTDEVLFDFDEDISIPAFKACKDLAGGDLNSELDVCKYFFSYLAREGEDVEDKDLYISTREDFVAKVQSTVQFVLSMAFSLTPEVKQQLIEDVKELGIGAISLINDPVSLAIFLTPYLYNSEIPYDASQLVADCTVLTRLVGTDLMLVLSVAMYLMGSESDLGANLVRSFMVHFPEVGHALLKDYLANLE